MKRELILLIGLILIFSASADIFTDSTAPDFQNGTFNNTFYNSVSSRLQLNATFTNGTFSSRTFDGGFTSTFWINFTWVEAVPYGEILPNNKVVESALGGANMSRNILLLHMDDVGGQILDNSGEGHNVTPEGSVQYNQTGMFNGSILLDDSGFLQLNTTPVLNSTTQFTLELWIKDFNLSQVSLPLIQKGSQYKLVLEKGAPAITTIPATGVTFTKRDIDLAIGKSQWIWPVDFDMDGDMDVVAPDDNVPGFYWYENDGTDLTFTQRTIGTVLTGAKSIQPVDFDGDGDTDVVTVDGATAVSWYENDGTDLSFTLRAIDTTMTAAEHAFPIDFDGDGDMDVVGADDGGLTGVLVWYNNTGTNLVFTKITIASPANGARRIWPTDFDKDGDMDVVSGDSLTTASWYENGGTDTVFTARQITAAGVKLREVFPVDFDVDGDTDIIASEDNNGELSWYDNDGTNLAFTKRLMTTFTGLKAKVAFPVDFDGDGDTDVVAGAENDGFRWIENSGDDLTFTENIISDIPTNKAKMVFPVDFDGDGDIDIVGADDGNKDLVWFETSSNTVTGTAISSTDWTYLAATYDGTTLSLYLNGSLVSSSTFGAPAISPNPLLIGKSELYLGSNAFGFGDNTDNISEFFFKFNGTIDELAIHNVSLSSTEITDHYKRTVGRLNVSVKSCDDINCTGDGINQTFSTPGIHNFTLPQNQYFQYFASFFTFDAAISPFLFNVTIGADVSSLTADILAPTTDLILKVGDNFTFTCEAGNEGSVNFTNVTLVGQYNNGTLQIIPNITGAEIKANESSNFSISVLPANSTINHSWTIQALKEFNNIVLQCFASTNPSATSTITVRVDIINTTDSISISLDKTSYRQAQSSVATLTSDITEQEYNVVWLFSNGSVINGCNNTGETPETKGQIFFETCNIPETSGLDNISQAMFYLDDTPSLNASVNFNITTFVAENEYVITNIKLTDTTAFLQKSQSVMANIKDNNSEPAINECCSIHLKDPNTGVPLFAGPVKTIFGDGVCFDTFILDFQTFDAPQDYAVKVEAWQCSDEDLPSSQRKRGEAESSFSILEYATNNDALLPLKSSATQFAGLTNVIVLHNRTNNFGQQMEVKASFNFANNVTEEDFVFSQFQELPFSVNLNTTVVEYALPIPPTLDSGTYRIELKFEYFVDDILREIDLIRSEAFTVKGVNDTFQLNEVFLRNSENNRTNETTTAPLGAAGRPRLFLTEGMPFDVCFNYTSPFTDVLSLEILTFNLIDDISSSTLLFPEAAHEVIVPPGAEIVHCFPLNLPLDVISSDSWSGLLDIKLAEAEAEDIIVRRTNFLFIDEIVETFFTPKFHIEPNSTFTGFPGIFVKDELGSFMPIFDDVQNKKQSEIPWGSTETCFNKLDTSKNFTCDYTKFLEAGKQFSVCFAIQNFLDTEQFISLVELSIGEDKTNTVIDFSSQIPEDAFREGVENGFKSTFDSDLNKKSIFGVNRTGLDEICSVPFTLPEDIIGSNAWDVNGIFTLSNDPSTFWRFESDEFTISGSELGDDLINITSIQFEPGTYVPGEKMDVQVNFTAHVPQFVESELLEIKIHDIFDTEVFGGQDFGIGFGNGKNSVNLTFTISSVIQDFFPPFELEVEMEFGGREFFKFSDDTNGLTFNVTDLFSTNTITDTTSYFTGEQIQICASVTNNLNERVPFDITYNYRCGDDNSTIRSILGTFTETRGISGSLTQNQCHDFIIPVTPLFQSETVTCQASTQVQPTGVRFTGLNFPTNSSNFNITNPIKILGGWDRDNKDFKAIFNVSGPSGNFDLEIPVPQELDSTVFINSINATFNGTEVPAVLRVKTNNDKIIFLNQLTLGTTIQKLNLTLSLESRLPHNITSSLITQSINGSIPLNITYNITLAHGDGFLLGQRRGVVFIYEFISENGTGTIVDQDDFDGIVTPLIVETSVTVGTPTTITVSMVPKLPIGTYAIFERIRLKEKNEVVFNP